jgi:hypothetical protein
MRLNFVSTELRQTHPIVCRIYDETFLGFRIPKKFFSCTLMAFSNYVEKILPIIDHLPTPCWHCWRNSFAFVIRENTHTVDISSTPYLPCLVNVVCERPLWLSNSSNRRARQTARHRVGVSLIKTNPKSVKGMNHWHSFISFNHWSIRNWYLFKFPYLGGFLDTHRPINSLSRVINKKKSNSTVYSTASATPPICLAGKICVISH